VINRWHERSGLDPADVGVIISHFEREPKLTKRAYMALTKVSAATASRVIARLLASGLITQEGAGAATCYRLA
jgi:predicted HTH transcriptional regulator